MQEDYLSELFNWHERRYRRACQRVRERFNVQDIAERVKADNSDPQKLLAEVHALKQISVFAFVCE